MLVKCWVAQLLLLAQLIVIMCAALDIQGMTNVWKHALRAARESRNVANLVL